MTTSLITEPFYCINVCNYNSPTIIVWFKRKCLSCSLLGDTLFNMFNASANNCFGKTVGNSAVHWCILVKIRAIKISGRNQIGALWYYSINTETMPPYVRLYISWWSNILGILRMSTDSSWTFKAGRRLAKGSTRQTIVIDITTKTVHLLIATNIVNCSWQGHR